ncbi:sulfatase-like hydrolase/transferase [Flammeovirga sp. SubArs3]|uniref:sulfatase family protein n=1 Tax=Flammeovirga sp. SubArs3 TaxID=2995316 RepID=UPI00248D1FB7|nr:sulfatase-like hydrolase/transferase [Flammeovirga sp. SubArs3]
MKLICTLLFMTIALNSLGNDHKRKSKSPNILIIVSDDQGWADVGFHGSDIPTPNLDALAKNGITFSQGYVSHPYCSPSRAGLLSGRYQQKFGHENNIPYVNPTEKDGLPLDEQLLSEFLQENGYQTCAIGKWHLGDHPRFWPNNRGFNHWFGFYGGHSDYWGNYKNNDPIHGILKDGKPVNKEELTYLTDDFSTAAINYIEAYTKSDSPFFMYLAYNAPHAPIQAPKKYLNKVSHIEDGERAAYASLVVGMDIGIGKIVQKLKEENVYENTIIIFLSDNGPHIMGASGYPFRGHKGMLFEAGIRVPFIISWPDQLPSDTTYDAPISSLDLFPTVASAAKLKVRKKVDGVDLLPFLTEKQNGDPHKTLYWRYSDGAGYAIRHKNYKLIYSGYKEKHFLFDLDKDPYESNDLFDSEKQVAQQLSQMYKDWNGETVPAKWQDPHAENVLKEEKKRQYFIDKASKGEKQNQDS